MITIQEYVKGLFDLEIVTECYILEKKPTDGLPYATEFVVSATDLFDKDTVPAVKDKEFHIDTPCYMWYGFAEGIKMEFLKDEGQLPPDSSYQGYRHRVTMEK